MKKLVLLFILIGLYNLSKAQDERKLAEYVFNNLNNFRIKNGVHPLTFNEVQYAKNITALETDLVNMRPKNGDNINDWRHSKWKCNGENLHMIYMPDIIKNDQDLFKELDVMFYEYEDYDKYDGEIISTWATSPGHRYNALSTRPMSCSIIVKIVPFFGVSPYERTITYPFKNATILIIYNLYNYESPH